MKRLIKLKLIKKWLIQNYFNQLINRLLASLITNRDEYLYYNITTQAEKEFDTILHQDCLRRQDGELKAHFLEQGLLGY